MARLVLIDGHAILHRAFHAYPPFTTSKGELVGAVYGFTSILLTVLAKLHPEYVAVAFDLKEPTFRHIQFKAYKAHRKPMDEGLVGQIPRVHEVVEALNIPIFEVEGYEGDDVIGTLAKQAARSANEILMSPSESNSRDKLVDNNVNQRRSHCEGSQNLLASQKSLEVVIVTGDQDALQLVTDKVKVYMPGRGKQPEQIFGPTQVEQKYGLKPGQIIDFKALAGDPSDGIPGVTGIGPKTARQLLIKYQTLEGIYQHLDNLAPKLTEKLQQGKEKADLSYRLATINTTQVPIKLKLSCCKLTDYDKQKVIDLFEKLDFKSLIKKLPNDDWEEMVEETMGIRAKKEKDKGQMELF